MSGPYNPFVFYRHIIAYLPLLVKKLVRYNVISFCNIA